MPPLTVEQTLQVAREHHQAGRLTQAEALYRQILEHQPHHADALHLLGMVAGQTGRHDLAVELIGRAITLKPSLPEAYNNLGVALDNQGHFDAAIAACRQAITLKPDYPGAYFNLGNALHAKGQLDAAIAAYQQAIVLNPNYPVACYNLGNAWRDKGQRDEAIIAYRQAIALNPHYAEAHCNLGVALKDLGQLDTAIASYRQAIALKPSFPEAHCNLGVALCDQGLWAEAIDACRQAAALAPDNAEIHSHLGGVLKSGGQFDAAIAACRQAIAINHGFPDAYGHLGNALQALGQHGPAIDALRQAVALDPNNAEMHSNLHFAQHADPACDARMMAAEHRLWNLRHAEPLQKFIPPHANDRNPERRLRVGYVSPDFREHPVGRFLLPLLAHHDKYAVEVFTYAQVPAPDPLTQRLRAHVAGWRSIVGLSEAQAAELIRQDQIDILVDLAGHTAGNRLLVFARKPAPVQATYLGYPDTTGLTTMDYRLTDAHADPPGLTESLHSEQLIRLPRSNWIYQPPDNCPAPAHRPDDASVTFGSFNNLAKVTEPMLKVWARILAAVPGSRLLLKAIGLASPDVRQRVHGIFQGEGIAPERVELVSWRQSLEEHLALYHRVAIGLDTFPYHGTATTCEALWMGVPVVTLAGRTHVARVGVSLLANVGLPELIAEQAADYVRIAATLANDPARLRDLHATLRQRMQVSPLMDAPRFARHVEAAYRQMWRHWCATT